MEGKTEYGKGSAKRPMNRKAFEESYKEIYGEKEIKVWIPDPEDDPRNIKDKNESE